MSIDVTTIPKTLRWGDMVIDADKAWNWHSILQVVINNARIHNLQSPEVVGDALSLGNPIPVIAGDAPFSFNDTVRATTSTTFIKLKETRIWRPGTYRISFELSSAQQGTWVLGVITRNNTTAGTLRQTNNAFWTTFTEDITGWKAGDFVGVYVRTTNAHVHAEVRNLRLYIHESDVTEKIM